MQLGNRETIGIEFVPVTPAWAHRSLCGADSWAGMALYVRGKNLCEHVIGDAAQIESFLYVECAPVVRWFAASAKFLVHEQRARHWVIRDGAHEVAETWYQDIGRRFFDLPDVSDAELLEDEHRAGWEDRHFLRRADVSAWLPDIAFQAGEHDIVVTWSDAPIAGEVQPRFVNTPGDASVPRADFIRLLDALAQAAPSLITSDVLAYADPSELAWSDIISSGDVWFGDWFGDGGPLAELKNRYSRPTESPAFVATRDVWDDPAAPKALLQVEQDISKARWSYAVDMFRSGWLPVNAKSAATNGYAAARHLRDQCGLNGKPIGDIDSFGAMLEVVLRRVPEDSSIGTVCGLRDGMAAIVAPSADQPWVERMRFARGLGHILLDAVNDHGASGAVAERRRGSFRHARAGAFAAELLIPNEGIVATTGGEIDAATDHAVFNNLMTKFGVGATMTAQHLWNRGHLSSEAKRDALINKFSFN